MTVSTSLNKIIYQGNGATTVFPFTFPGVAAADIQVFFTDVLGNVTLLAASSYTLSLNAPTGTNPTGAGGSVTYNPLGVPIPINTSLTILRTLPLVQSTSLANQGTLYQPVEEAALDYLMMTVQQTAEIGNRELTVAVSDPPPNPLPAVAARANQVLGFDASGNPIAVSSLPAGTVSSAMQPVVNAATLAAGRSAFGLGSIATETIGLGLQDNGANAIQTFFNTVADSTNQTVTSSFHQNIRAATGALNYTLPKASTLFNGFGFWVYALTGAITFIINAADAFSGAGTGASLVIPPGSRVFVSTDAAGSGTWYIRPSVLQGFNAPLNLQLNASAGSGSALINIKDANGNDPSPASPITVVHSFNGNATPRAITVPLSLTIPSGASLGTVSGQAFRIWVGLFDNAGTPVLGVYNSLSGTNVQSWNEAAQSPGVAISAGATQAQTWYTNGSIAPPKSFRILGYFEGVQGGGAWTTGLSLVQLFGPGIKRPGDTVQEAPTKISASGSTTSSTFVALPNQTAIIGIQSAANLIRVEACGQVSSGGSIPSNQTGQLSLSRGTVANANLFGDVGGLFGGITGVASGAYTFGCTGALFGYDLPNQVGNVTYAVQGNITGGNTLTFGPNAQMLAREIMV